MTRRTVVGGRDEPDAPRGAGVPPATESPASGSGQPEAPAQKGVFVGFTSGERFATVGELYDEAHSVLAAPVWDFLDGGAGGEETLAANGSGFARWSLRPRLMTGAGEPDLTARILGIDLTMPILTGPFGADRLFHPEGQCAVARANAKAGTASIVPEAGSFSWEEVAAAGLPAARVAQLHPMGDVRRFSASLRRAAEIGFDALCLTLDCPTAGWRERNMRNRFDLDMEVVAGNYPAASPAELADTLGQLFVRHEPTWTWAQLADLMAASPLPWIAKGILTGHDAAAAVASGAGAVLVSNHGGRQLDAVPAAIDVLPEVVEVIAGAVPILLDSGVRRGTDVAKALALGADAVVLGRAAAMALAADGESGVSRLLELIREELSTTVKLLGASGAAGLGPQHVTAAAGYSR